MKKLLLIKKNVYTYGRSPLEFDLYSTPRKFNKLSKNVKKYPRGGGGWGVSAWPSRQYSNHINLAKNDKEVWSSCKSTKLNTVQRVFLAVLGFLNRNISENTLCLDDSTRKSFQCNQILTFDKKKCPGNNEKTRKECNKKEENVLTPSAVTNGPAEIISKICRKHTGNAMKIGNSGTIRKLAQLKVTWAHTTINVPKRHDLKPKCFIIWTFIFW